MLIIHLAFCIISDILVRNYILIVNQPLFLNQQLMYHMNYTDLKSNVGEAAFATRREGVDRPTSSKGSKNNEAYV